MVEKHLLAAEFAGVVSREGAIRVPQEICESMGVTSGSRVVVRLTTKNAAASLKKKDVTDQAIDRISALQLEPIDQVVKFLLSEGKMKSKRRRLKKLTGGGKPG